MASLRKFAWPTKAGSLLVAAISLFHTMPASGIILYRTGDPTANTTAPTGSLADSGWQYEGTYGNYLGTPIAPHFFITAQHIGAVSNTFTFQGANYTIVNLFDDPSSDLRIFEVAETFPVYAPFYTGSDEVGTHLVVIGRGTQRGGVITTDGVMRGWQWGGSDVVQRWGENTVSAIRSVSSAGDMVYALFDSNGLPNECDLSSGDSGGGVFIDDNGVWKLAGINYDVDYVYTGPNGSGILYAALFDQRTFYGEDQAPITGTTAVPSGFYASRISSHVAWIDSVIEPRLVNISARAVVGTGDDVAIAGFIIGGNAGQTERVIILGLGPSLAVNGVPIPGRLADPILELHDSNGALTASNDNWRDGPQATEIESSGLAPTNDNEAAILATLSPGNNTAVLSGANGGTGIGLIEVYDADGIGNAQLLNLSTRASVGVGDSVLIGGVIVHSATQRLLLRALGPDLAGRGITGALSDPVMELHDSNGALVSTNDDWGDAPNSSEIMATGLAPADPRDSAILLVPSPGNYTAVVQGVGESTGVALLEAYLFD